jgi:tRNA-dihydrouridine synthase B
MTALSKTSVPAPVERASATALPTLRIGQFAFDHPVVQAALSGYSDSPMRLIARRLGAPYTLCEVMLDTFVLQVKRRKKTGHLLYVADEEHPVGGQLMGAAPEQFGPAARRLVEQGFDVIDINFGCPVKKVLGRCRGGYHLSQPTVALEIIARVREVLPPSVPVSVKMRRGIDDSAESRDKFFQVFDGAYALGAAAVTVHGRTVEQRYEGHCDWNFLRELKRHAGARVVLGSGDLWDANACIKMLRQTGVDGVTVARGAIGNPWIFRQTRDLAGGLSMPNPPTLAEQREVIAEHYSLAESLYGPWRCIAGMRKFGIKYSQLHPQHESVRTDFCQVKKPSDWREVLEKWY